MMITKNGHYMKVVICSDMDDCEKMLTDAWPIHCGPCIINVSEEFSNFKLSKKCDILLILNDKETDNNNEQHQYDGFHTLQDNNNDLVLCNMSLFCSSGFDKECNTKGCPKVNKCRQRKFKKCHQQGGEQNLIYLTNWPFVHPPNVTTTNSTKMLITKPPPFDGEQQSQQCTCLNDISYTKQITTSYSFSKPPT